MPLKQQTTSIQRLQAEGLLAASPLPEYMPLVPETVVHDDDDRIHYQLYYQLVGGLAPSRLVVSDVCSEQIVDWVRQLSPTEFSLVRRKAWLYPGNVGPLKNDRLLINWQGKAVIELDIMTLVTSITCLYDHSAEADIIDLLDKLPRFVRPKRRKRHYIHLIQANSNGFELRREPIRHIRMNLADHYDPTFVAEVPGLLKTARNTDANGLILLHGTPGTGKTTFIRYLISKISRFRKVIYLPVHLAHNLSDPQFLPFLLENSGSILVIEDAEGILRPDLGGQRSPALTNLLNIGDGLLGDFLRIQIICTFNQPIQTLDPALTRQGRLLFAHEFRALPPAQANQLAAKLGITTSFHQPTTLAQLYHISGKTPPRLLALKQTIGFGKSEDDEEDSFRFPL